ncbi:hypothetical protein [Nonomuraea endophytica]|uniref:hypothetical protein n=1 Tax=Nonomuraea endophytica TaxID=714136 RepID=UPI0037C5BA90
MQAPSTLPTVALPVAMPRVRDLRPAWSQDQDRLVETYGRTGVRLLERLDTSDTHACLLLAVIAMLRGYPEESRNWLRKLANAGDMAALRLFNDPAPQSAAAELAYRYGREHLEAHPGRDSLAMYLYRLAAEHGHVDAAFQLAVYHQRREEYGPAAVWFEHAAKRGHPDAVVRSGDLAAQIMAEQAIAPN